ncbi:MAG: DUF2141 domain-containing protein [Acidobacteria bacterium]|nr:DUF2141 domain-containing protein [Acidobacteriota bacterium]MBI3263647.1 DUF2141 domain-containing protein [Acidobacteriota bacterium]
MAHAHIQAEPDKTGVKLIVRIAGFPNDRGSAGIALWKAPRGFPEDIEHAIRTIYVSIHNHTATTTFEGVAPGIYAVTVLHDQNDNRKFDKNPLGIPREAWGVSGNVRPRMRAPRFAEARFRLEKDLAIDIRVR